MGGPGKGGVGLLFVADFPVKGDIVGRHLVHQWRSVRCGLLRVGNPVERFVVDPDQFERVVCSVLVFGNHYGHAVAHIADRVCGQHCVVWDFHVG